ncbi:hypothetical protein, partial [Endozoicomonas arenosclerae]|uniref:hypothetical protein n=1 Tax=Endozoicomonas arenosclerae TaxID=1633495 RepID=UPI000AA5337A
MYRRSTLSIFLASSVFVIGSFSLPSSYAGETFKWVEHSYDHGSDYRAVIDISGCNLEKRSDQPSTEKEDDWTYSFSLKGATATKVFSRSRADIKPSYNLRLNDYM